MYISVTYLEDALSDRDGVDHGETKRDTDVCGPPLVSDTC